MDNNECIRTDLQATCSKFGTMDNNDLMEIIKHITADNKDLKKRIDILEEILSSFLPIVGEDKE